MASGSRKEQQTGFQQPVRGEARTEERAGAAVRGEDRRVQEPVPCGVGRRKAP